ncbi:hypothetical protein SELMODRAFT_445444 [Selaginella moellendorffii]|uniref:Uncharacterized protein n=1 Tax=Selaginella moellendorffii TaxID=88036 RepID=D8SIQ8_SELML|nr:uncharacterized protein LOC9654459 [Selaginella moellendorffii]EFJ15665.1 hypothetical protein SELMODRAFT_445444 [Selaginella moellendorffii]|eukprot:XP_002983323.1 uncharacterized protein LOC9654459 [Selaginella moellendorffii]
MPVAEDIPAEALEEALDSPPAVMDDSPAAPAGERSSEVDSGEKESATEEKSSESIEATENGADAPKEVDESAAENIAQPEVPEESKWAAEEVQGPELTSDRVQGAEKEGHEEDLLKEKQEEKNGEMEKESSEDVVNALYERMSSAVASAHSDGKKDKDHDRKDPVVDSVMAVAAPFVEFAVAQAQFLKNGMSETTDVAVRAACNQLSELQDSSTTQYYYAKDMFWRFKREYREYENVFFSTLKDGVKAATASPGMAAMVATGAAFLFLRRPRRLLFKYTLGRFRSQEAMAASAQKKVVELREALELQKNEKRKLEERFRLAEDEFLRGQSKMANAGSQIRSLVKSMYKTENHAQGLLEKLRDMSGKPAFHLRAEVASMASEAKAHRSSLDRNLYRIASHNIRV